MINRKIVLTGSHVYGPATDESDIDIVINSIDDLRELKRELMAKDIEITHSDAMEDYGSESFYFKIGILKFNVIHSMSDTNFEQWRHATAKMKKLRPIPDREKRIETFRKYFSGEE